jgi:hypothetical protein
MDIIKPFYRLLLHWAALLLTVLGYVRFEVVSAKTENYCLFGCDAM